MRIRLASLHNPTLAVSSREIDPLPHQIRAVYEEMLPRTPLRFCSPTTRVRARPSGPTCTPRS
jgi:hypothetical protein